MSEDNKKELDLTPRFDLKRLMNGLTGNSVEREYGLYHKKLKTNDLKRKYTGG